MDQDTTLHVCSICGREFRPRDAETLICPDCGGPPEAPAPSQPQETMSGNGSQRMAQANRQVSTSPQEWQEGDVILDLYEVKGEVGRGGLAAVYRVHHRRWNMDLAVKRPLPHLQQYADSMEAFTRQARAWLDLGLHPHIVTCYYVRRVGDVPCMFTEYIEGGSLKDWIEDGRLYAGDEREALKRILDVAIQFAWGLEHVHQRGFVHQNAGPGSALMTSDGRLKLAGFGLLGGKGYPTAQAAPEQELGQAVSPRTDIWGWGVTVLEMFTGKVRWGAGSIAASVLESYLQEASPEGIPPMPAALAELLRQCFQDDPDQRPASMDEVAERLMRLYEQETGTPYPRPKPQALELRADNLNNKAISLLDLGLEEEAVRCWQEALQADPAHLEANFNYRYYRWHKAELLSKEFLAQLQHLEPNHKDNPEYWRLLGWVYLEQGYVEEVGKILTKRSVEDKALRRAHTAPDRPVGRKVRRFKGHTIIVFSVAFSPDGRYALAGSGDETVRLWEVATGRKVRRFEGHTDSVATVAFSPDGRYVLSGGWDKTVRVWEVATGHEVRRFKGHTDSVKSVAFSPDGRYALSGSDDSTVRLWDAATGREVRCFKGHTDSVISVAFSPDGRYALSGSEDNTMRLWDVTSGQEVRCFEGHSWPVTSVTFSPNGRYVLSGSEDETVRLWKVATGQEVRRFEGHTDSVWSVAFSPDGRYALSGSWDKTLRLWEVATGREVRRFEGHTDYVYSVAFSPDGRYALSGSADDTVRLWEVKYPPFCPGGAHPFPLLTRARAVEQLSAERRRLAELLGQAQTEMARRAFRQAYCLLRQAQELPDCVRDQQTLSLLTQLGQIGLGRRVGLRNGWLARCFEGHTHWMNSVAFSPDGRYALSGSVDKTLRLWGVTSGQEVRRFEGHTDDVNSVAFSSDGRYALSGSGSVLDIDNTLRLWDVATGREVRRFEGHTKEVNSIAFSPDGRYALSGSADDTLRLWDAATGREVRRFEGHTDDVLSVAFSPDGRYALSGSADDTLRLWDAATGREVRRFEGHTERVRSVAFSPDGRYALSGSDDSTVRLWDAATGREVRCFEGHTERVRSVAFSPDGRYALSGTNNKTVHLWDVATGQEIRRFEGHTAIVNSVVFSPDGRYALSGSA